MKARTPCVTVLRRRVMPINTELTEYCELFSLSDLVMKCQSFSAVVSGFPSTGGLVSPSLASSLLNSVLFISSTSSSTCMDKDKSSYGNMTTRQRAASKKKKKCPFYLCDSVSYCTYIFSLISFACLFIYLLVVVADEGRWRRE